MTPQSVAISITIYSCHTILHVLCLPLKCLFFLRFHKPLIVSFKLIIITKSRSIRVLHHSFINTNHNSFPHALMNYQISHQYTCSNNQTLQLSKLRRINFGDVISTCLWDCSRHKLQRGRLLYSGWDLPSQAKRDTFSPVTTSHQFRKRSYLFTWDRIGLTLDVDFISRTMALFLETDWTQSTFGKISS